MRDEERLDSAYTVRFTTADARYLDIQAKDQGVTSSEYIRIVFLRGLEHEPQLSLLARTLSKMRQALAEDPAQRPGARL